MRPWLQRILGRFTELIDDTRSTLTRIITRRVRRYSMSPTRDWGRPDYAFWDRARRAKARGLEISGAFIKPLGSKIAAWTMGRRPQWTAEREAGQEALGAWWGDNHANILRAYEQALDLGDYFLVINPDLSTTLVPPHVVEPIVAEDDFSHIVGWEIVDVIPHPTRTGERMRKVETYTAMERTIRVEINGQLLREERYPNLIGRLPIVHISNPGGADEVFGRPEAEGLIPLLHVYGEVLDAAADGNIEQGRSTPVAKFDTIEGFDRFWSTYGGTTSQTLPDGSTETTEELEVDLTQILTMVGGEFNYKSPAAFMEQTERLLAILFYLLVQHSEIPEFIWGTAIASSKASAEAQMPSFVKFIEMKQGQAARWLVEIAEVALAYLSLIEPGVAVETPTLVWEALTEQDGALTLAAAQWALTEGLITKALALMLAPIDVDDPEQAVQDAEAEIEAEAARQRELPGALGEGMTEEQVRSAFDAEIERLEAAA